MSQGNSHHGAYTEETGSGWVMKGNHSYHEGDYQTALKCYLEALRREPLKTAIWNIHNRLCATYTRLQDYQNALSEAEAMIQWDAKHPKGHIRRGGAMFFLGRYAESLQEYEQVRSLLTDPHSDGILSPEQLQALQRYSGAARAKLAEQQKGQH